MSKPVPGISIEEKFGLVKAVLKCGANIAELNCVRKQVSAVKGGRLARAAGAARIHTLALSDVPGDDPAIIGSGPTVPDPDAQGGCAGHTGALPRARAARRHGLAQEPGRGPLDPEPPCRNPRGGLAA